METLSENKRRGNFIRVYPAQGSYIYDAYFEQSKNTNKFLYQCLYGKSLFTEGSDPGRIVRSRINNSKNAKTKIGLMIDNSDILIEYMERLATCIKNILPVDFKQEWRRSIINFINNSMWKKPLPLNQT